MRKKIIIRFILPIVIVSITISGCSIKVFSGQNFNHRASKQCSEVSTVIPGGRLFTNLTYTDITVVGQETSKCTVDAELTVSATSQEIADNVAEQLKVELIQETDRLVIVVQKPTEYMDDYNVSGKMTIAVPTQTYLEMITTYGDCQFEKIQRDIDARSTYGDMEFDDIQGDIVAVTTYGGIRVLNLQNESLKLNTKYGKIVLKDCKAPVINCLTTYNPIRLNRVKADSLELGTKYGEIELTHCVAKEAVLDTSYGAVRGDIADINQITAQTSYAPIRLKCINAANPNIVAVLKTKYDHIKFCPPEGFAGSVNASTSYGKIRTDQSIQVQGTIDDRLNGTIGQGDGSITMTNKYGNITLKNPE